MANSRRSRGAADPRSMMKRERSQHHFLGSKIEHQDIRSDNNDLRKEAYNDVDPDSVSSEIPLKRDQDAADRKRIEILNTLADSLPPTSDKAEDTSDCCDASNGRIVESCLAVYSRLLDLYEMLLKELKSKPNEPTRTRLCGETGLKRKRTTHDDPNDGQEPEVKKPRTAL